MAREEEIKKLKQHIQDISEEIISVKKLINPHLRLQDYKDLYARFNSLTNLKAIALNEIESFLHYYKVALSGKRVTTKNEATDKVFRSRFKSEIDCKLRASKNLDVSINAHHEMFLYIREHYARLFTDGKFKIKSIIQLY